VHYDLSVSNIVLSSMTARKCDDPKSKCVTLSRTGYKYSVNRYSEIITGGEFNCVAHITFYILLITMPLPSDRRTSQPYGVYGNRSQIVCDAHAHMLFITVRSPH